MLKYQKTIDQIHKGELTRQQLEQLRENARVKLDAGDSEASSVLEALGGAEPADDAFYFMGFCPWGKLENRLDFQWRAEGTLVFDYDEAADQKKLFREIRAGDLVILKTADIKRRVMHLYGHGRVRAVDYVSGNDRLSVSWAPESTVISVPLVGCTRTVNRKSREKVIEAMPQEFFDWLKT